jgi:hypothetical protein
MALCGLATRSRPNRHLIATFDWPRLPTILRLLDEGLWRHVNCIRWIVIGS